MKSIAKFGVLSLLSAATFAPAAAQAGETFDWFSKENLQVRARMIAVNANGDGHIVGTSTETDVTSTYTPEIDISYFFTDHIAAELIAATSKHVVKAGGGDVGSAWILPPSVTLQYHFQPKEDFSPYVGAGLNYSMFYGDEDASGYSDFDVDGGFGYVVQAGFDYWLNDNWGINFDVKYVELDVDVTVKSGVTPLQAKDVDLDPIIAGVGVSYRF